MKGIIKSQLYETKGSWAFWIAGLLTFVMALIDWIEGPNFYVGEGPYTGMAALANSDHSIPMYFFCFVIASFMCRDWKNKTMYLDVLSGYSRREVFFGRVIPAFLIGVIATLLFSYGGACCYSMVNGWGLGVDIETFFVVMLQYILLLFRLMGEMVLLSILVKRTSIVVIAVLILDYLEFTILIAGMGVIKNPWYFGLLITKQWVCPEPMEILTNEGELLQIYSYGALSFEDGMVMVSSFVIGGICLLAAYRMFAKKQLS